jgi:hypothetical protein
MFINNKYKIWYFSIIENAKTRPVNGYTERHHIIPRSLGGQDAIENLVSLTAREHFICHLLLVKITEGRNKDKMTAAVWGMVIRNSLKMTFNSHTYENLRIKHAQSIGRINQGKIPWNKGKKIGSHSEERKKKISESVKVKMKELGYNVK